MTSIFSSTIFALLAASVTTVQVPTTLPSDVTVNHGIIWQTDKSGDDSQGFFLIHNNGGTPDILTAWSCTIAGQTVLVDGDGKPLSNLKIPPNQTITLGPRGPHLELRNNRFSIIEGSVIPCSVTFQNDGEMQVMLYSTPMPKS
jgi:copper(I)-binding protein